MADLQRIRQLAGLSTKQNISEGWMGSDDPVSWEKGGTKVPTGALGTGELDDSIKRELVRNFKDNGGDVEQTLRDARIHPSKIENAIEYLHYVRDMEGMPEEPHADYDEEEVIIGLDDNDYFPEDPEEYGELSADLDAEHYGKRFEEEFQKGDFDRWKDKFNPPETRFSLKSNDDNELRVGDYFEWGYFNKKSGEGEVLELIGPPGREWIMGKTQDGKTSKFPYRGSRPKNGYYIKKKLNNNKLSSNRLYEAADESWIHAYKALEANGGEPTLDKPRLFIQQMAMIAKDMGIKQSYLDWFNNKQFVSLLSQYIDPEERMIGGSDRYGKKFQNYATTIWQALENAPSVTEIKKYSQQSQTQDTQHLQQQQMSALQHDLSAEQLVRKNELDKADTNAMIQMDYATRQAIKERQQELELEAKERLSQIEIEIRNSKEPEEIRKQELEMAKINHSHEIQVINATAEGEYKKAFLEADYQIKIKQLENIDNQQERQAQLDSINAEKNKELAKIDAETNSRLRQIRGETDAERERTDIAVDAERERSEIEIDAELKRSEMRIREEFMTAFKPVWTTMIEKASEVGNTVGQNIRSLMAALGRLGKPVMPQAQQSVLDKEVSLKEKNIMDDLQRIKKLAGISVNENVGKNNNSPDDEEHVPEDPAEYAERSADLDAEAYGKRFEEDLEEGSGPKEKQHSKHVDRNSPEHREAVARQKKQIAAAADAKPGQELLNRIKNKDLGEGLDNGYKTREVSGSDFFPDGADGPVVAKVGPSGAKQGDNPEQKKMQIDEVHREMVYQYRKFLKEGSSKN